MEKILDEAGEGSTEGRRIHQRLATLPKKARVAVHDIEILSQKRGKNLAEERFKVTPDYAYPNARFTRDELRKEMNAPSEYYHDLAESYGSSPDNPMIGKLSLEILQCFGIPKEGVIRESSDFCIAVCGKYAFKTDVMPPVANPIWLSKMRRACIFPIYEAYARLYVGVFGQSTSNERRDGFAGRIVLDLSRLRPGSLYDVTLPLRSSSHIYTREHRGAIRVRFHLQWYSEREAILSYLPKRVSDLKPHVNESCTISCCDVKSFQNVARTVHGNHFPGRFTMDQFKATMREINFTRIHVLRHLRKREFYELTRWHYPLISGFVFLAWMHCIYEGSLSHAPGHLLTYLLLHLWKNYAYYAMDSPVQNGFLAPTWEELFAALFFGGSKGKGRQNRQFIEPLSMEAKDKASTQRCWDDMETESDRPDPLAENSTASMAFCANDLLKIGTAFRRGVKTRSLRHGFRVYRRAFQGRDAVNFLVKSGFSKSRESAMHLGQRFMAELKLFEHVRHRQEAFKDDESHFYHFIECDLREYETKTHEPQGKFIMKCLGLMPDKVLEEADVHLEMPYATGVDHPRFKVKDSLVIRSKESKKLLLHEQQQETIHLDDSMSSSTNTEQLSKDFDHLLDHSNSNEEDQDDKSTTMSVQDTEPREEVYIENGVVTHVKYLKSPPHQDLNVKSKNKKKLTDVLALARHKVHGVFLHAFNDRVYPSIEAPHPLDPAIDETRGETASTGSGNLSTHTSSPPKSITGKSEASISTSSSRRRRRRHLRSRSSPSKRSTAEGPSSNNDNYDRLLQSGKYSNGNPLISKVGVIVQPIIEIVLAFLCLFRALFNLFTWRDPILSFWVSLLGPILVIILHLVPWRILLGVIGFVLFGPQNFLFRLVWEHGKEDADLEFNPDKVIKKKKLKDVDVEEDAPLFTNYTPNNDPLTNDDIDDTEIRKVVVPNSPLMYQRFYDWPPENQYAFVSASDPPESLRPTLDSDDETEMSKSQRSNASDRRGLRLRNRRRSKSPIVGRRVRQFVANRREQRKNNNID